MAIVHDLVIRPAPWPKLALPLLPPVGVAVKAFLKVCSKPEYLMTHGFINGCSPMPLS